MVHAFAALGVYMALDSESGAVHVVDRLAYEVLRRWEFPRDQWLEPLCGDFGRDQVMEAIAEIEELKQQGMLFANPDYSEVVARPRASVIKALCLHVAHDCNLRCAYCFASTGDFHGPREMMSAEVGKRALEFLMQRSGNRRFLEVDFFGGEPLMNFNVVRELVAYGRDLEKQHGKRIRFTLTTNGLGLTDEVIAFLNAEMDNVVISIDGRREVHDAMRKTCNGRGSYDLIIKKAKKLADSRNQDKYYVRGTFTRNNLDFARDVLSLADEGFEQISVEPVVADGALPYSLQVEDLAKIFAEYESLASAMLMRRENGQWFNFFHFMIDLNGGPCVSKRLTGCGAGNEYVAVTPTGDIYPCHQFVGEESFRMGSVMDGSFDADMQQRFMQNHVLAKPECSQCWAKFYCSGGCAANAWQFNRDITKPYRLGCEMEKKRVECALAMHVLENRQKQANEQKQADAQTRQQGA